ncbi:hypothetical protein ACFLYO_03420 [Chloroflexota bacterium]
MSNDSTPREDLRNRAIRAMWADAFFRWESAVTIALTLLLAFFNPAPFEWWMWWMWVVAGGVAEGALIFAHLTDPQSAAEAVARLFKQEYDPADIQNRVSRQRLEKALEYRDGIAVLVAQQDGVLRMNLQETLDEIDDWIAQVYRLARRMDNFDENSILENDLKTVPTDLRNLRRRLELEESEAVKRELEDAVKLKTQQYRHLQGVADNMKRAEIQLENTLAALGTLYAQVQVIDTKDLDSARARRLREEVHSEVSELEDIILSMDEVYATNRLAD